MAVGWRFTAILFVFFCLIFSGLLGSIEDLYPLQGNVYNGTSLVSDGNVTFKFSYDYCVTPFYNSGNDFNLSIQNGQYDVYAGNQSLTSLKFDPTQRYFYIQEIVNGLEQDWAHVGGSCSIASNPFYMNNDTIDQRIDIALESFTPTPEPLARSVTYSRVLASLAGSLESVVQVANITSQFPQTDAGFVPLYVPRTLNYTLINIDMMFGVFYEFNVTGIDQDGNDYYEYYSGLLGAAGMSSFESTKAFAIAYNYTLNMSTNGGLFPMIQVDVGRGNWLGLPHYPLTKVYKAVAVGNQVQESIVYNTTYGKVYLNETWAGQDYTYWYVS